MTESKNNKGQPPQSPSGQGDAQHPGLSPDETRLAPPKKPAEADDKTRLAAPRRAAPDPDKTRLAPARTPVEDETRLKSTPSSHAQTIQVPPPAGAEQAPRLSDPTRLASLLGQYTARERMNAGESEAKVLASGALVLKSRFVLEAELGKGGMGTVYKARDLRKVEAKDSNPYIAAKVLNENFKDHPDAFVTLHREAKKSQMLAHPNIITVHDFDRDGDITFMTMELLVGQSLDLVIRENKSGLPKQQVLKIVGDYCEALAYAHKNSIIHLDFKPGNVFLTEEAVKVLDFGIARVAAEKREAGDFDAGSLGAVTPAYASLEMLSWQEPDPADDVYAAACVAYELFTGEHPYQRQGADVALEKQLKPKRIDGLSKRQWNALAGGLALTRENRTASIREFKDGLTGTRKPSYIAAAALVILALIGWLVYSEFFQANALSSVVQETLVKGEECYAGKNYVCAIDSASAVLQIEPGHKAAGTLLSKAQADYQVEKIAQFVLAGERCVAQRDFNCATNMIDDIRALDKTSDKAKALEAAVANAKTQVLIDTAMAQGKRCFDDADYRCALTQADSVLSLSATHEAAKTLRDEAQGQIDKQQRDFAKNQRLAAAAIDKANNCLNRKRFQCALSELNKALRYEPGNAEARQMRQLVQYSKQQYEEDVAKVDKILASGFDCLARKKTDCALSSSKSALAILPTYPRAKELNQKSLQAIQEAKDALSGMKIE